MCALVSFPFDDMQVQRSVSQSDMHDSNGRQTRQTNESRLTAEVSIYSGTKLKRCASLPAQQHPRNAYAKDTPNLKTQRESSVESLGKLRIGLCGARLA